MTQLFPSIFEEQGLPPSEKMLERFRIMSGQIRYTSDTLKDIRDSLHERDRINGPYYCAYPAFIDCYRLLARMAERVDFSSVLLCCTLLDSKGKPLDTGGELLKPRQRSSTMPSESPSGKGIYLPAIIPANIWLC